MPKPEFSDDEIFLLTYKVDVLARIRREVLTHKRLYPRVLSSAYAIEDAQTAIRGYLKARPKQKERIALGNYGVLQALYVQQDAIHEFNNLFDGKKKHDFPEPIRQVRDIRNHTVGHPANAHHKKTIVLGASGPGSESFSYAILSDDGRSEFKEVNIYDLVRVQRSFVLEGLENAITKLESFEKDADYWPGLDFELKNIAQAREKLTPYKFPARRKRHKVSKRQHPEVNISDILDALEEL